MIPLSHWLVADDTLPLPISVELDNSDGSQQIELPQDGRSDQSSLAVEEAYLRGRNEGRTAAELRLELALSEERAKAAEREDVLVAQWKERCSLAVTGEIAGMVASQMREIEAAVVDVLMPFLKAEASQAAAQLLLGLIGDVLADPESRVIEVRAPETLHEPLSRMLADRQLGAVLSQSDTVEIVAGSGKHRLVDVSEQWMKHIQEQQR